MEHEIRMPKLGLTMENGTVIEWHKNLGDSVKKGESVCDIETDKITHSVESPEDGVLEKIIVAVDEEVPVAAVLGIIRS